MSATVPLDCATVRDTLAADPAGRSAELDAHLAGCAACRAYAADMAALDAQVLRALRVPVPPARTATIVAFQPRATATPVAARVARTRRFALAASVAAVAVLAGSLWFAFPRDTLAGDIVGHMAEEPEAWSAEAPAMPASAVSYVLARAGLRLTEGTHPDVTYANACWFRGRFVAHFAVRSADGPVTALVLPAERVDGRRPFQGDGYRGVLVPAPRGAIAVLTRDSAPATAAALDDVAARIAAAVRYD